ncbi:tetratricopeptide repeat protein [Devosia sp. BSSL-BM10]|uniref:Tetratricopeptide repeat protein n=1 Tax=Devosia litorisediminis TaxID=2829817 RepID=A0A942E4C3_9HYPH|nr:tetratricopeptide repeat protein [Devosia litorisediminis]MBS3847730.1 tetratricopeptide repeat protein [Devosia litorisediminis]
MIEAYISGQAARVAFVQGDEFSYIDADNPKYEVKILAHQLAYVFADATDVERVLLRRKEDSYTPLLQRYNIDRALHMVDVALDRELSEELRHAAAETFVELTEDNTVLVAVKNVLYARPISSDHIDAARADTLSSIHSFNDLLTDLTQSRVLSHKVVASFERASKNMEKDTKSQIWATAVYAGLFRELVLAGIDAVKINAAVFHCYTVLSKFPNGRGFVKEWVRDLTVPLDRSAMVNTPEPDIRRGPEHVQWSARVASPHEMYSAVLGRQDSILEHLRAGDVGQARHFADQLVQWQLHNSDSSFASMSLSKLASEARRLKQRSVELEWAKSAIELNPVDAIAVSLLADTYLDLFRLREAEESFRNAIALGQREFGRVGVARTWRAAGKLEEAYNELLEIVAEFQDSDSIFHGWMIAAEIARERGEPVEALRLYEDALVAFPGEAQLWYGKGSALRDLRETEAAAEWLTRTVRTFPQDPTPLCILAEVYRDAGRYNQSLDTYKVARSSFPQSAVVRSGMAEVLIKMGQVEEALRIYSEAKRDFPNESVIFCGYAECLRNKGDLEMSLVAYEEAVSRFPLDLTSRGGRANVLKVMGRHQDAINAYDLNIRDFPFDLVSMSNRANLLRLLGRYTDAVDAYDLLLERRPDYLRARYAKAAILAASGDFSAAFELLPNTQPVTDDDWFAYHVRGMLNLRMNEIGEATRIFAWGKEQAPFGRREQFDRSWAVARMREKDFSVAARHLQHNGDTLELLLRARCLFELGELKQAGLILEAANDNSYPTVVLYRDELKRLVSGFSPTLPANQLSDAEAELLLQAA